MGHYKQALRKVLAERQEIVEDTEFTGTNREGRRHTRTHTGKRIHLVNPQSHSRMLPFRFSVSKFGKTAMVKGERDA